MTEPKIEPRRRFDQCSIACTVDCGHCKGDPVGALKYELAAVIENAQYNRDMAAERGRIMFAAEAENAGLREALEASKAEGGELATELAEERTLHQQTMAERDRLRMQRDEVWQRIDLWSDDPDTNLGHLLDVWTSHEKALAERDALRADVDRYKTDADRSWGLLVNARAEAARVVDAAAAAIAAIRELTGGNLSSPWISDNTRILAAAVDSYTQSSNPGETS